MSKNKDWLESASSWIKTEESGRDWGAAGSSRARCGRGAEAQPGGQWCVCCAWNAVMENVPTPSVGGVALSLSLQRS
eukprot:581128-Pelagomonas_calceolata.AAC.1